MDIIKISIIAIVCAVICTIVKSIKPEFLPFLQISSIVLIISLSADGFKTLLKSVEELIFENGADYEDFVVVLVKVLGIALITKTGSNVCKDSGNSTLSDIVEFAGKIIIISFCLPFIKMVIALADGLLK